MSVTSVLNQNFHDSAFQLPWSPANFFHDFIFPSNDPQPIFSQHGSHIIWIDVDDMHENNVHFSMAGFTRCDVKQSIFCLSLPNYLFCPIPSRIDIFDSKKYILIVYFQVYIHDSSMVPNYPLLFFGRKLNYVDGVINVDDFVRVRCSRHVAHLVQVSGCTFQKAIIMLEVQCSVLASHCILFFNMLIRAST